MLVTGATGGIGARPLARGARRARRVGDRVGPAGEVLEALAAEIGGRAIAADLAEPRRRRRALRRGGGRRRRARGERGAARQRRARRRLARGDRPRARRSTCARRSCSRGCSPRRWSRAARGHLVFVSSLSGKAAAPRSSLYSATKFGLRGFALGAAPGPARPRASASPASRPGSSATPACSPTPARAAAGRRHRDARGRSRAAIVRAIEHDRAEVDVAPLGLRAGARSPASRRCSPPRRRSGSGR